MPPVALTVAGSDPSGGAGLQADLKVFHAFGVYGAAVPTALTVQDTTGVHALHPLDAALVAAQLDAVLDDLTIAAAKTGMLATPAIVDAVARCFAARPAIPLVVDPVARAGAGQSLASGDVLRAIREILLPRSALVTPNLDEAAALVGRPVADVAGMRDAAHALLDLGARAVLVTGGHLPGRPTDIFAAAGVTQALDAPRVAVGRTHGTGCTLTAAITAALARGDTLPTAVTTAKAYIGDALAGACAVGRGALPLDHLVRPRRG